MKPVYFDHGSSSVPKAPGVAAAVSDYLNTAAYNVGRGAYAASFDLAMEVLQTRELLARYFNAQSPREVIFTPGLTHAINTILSGFLVEGDHVITSSMEHNAVMRPLYALHKERGLRYDVVDCDANGLLKPDDIVPLITGDTKALVLSHASNVCGTVQPLHEIAEICAKHKIRLIVDAAQTAGHLPLDASLCDALAFPGHKGLLGPTGIGGFIIKNDFASEVKASIWGGTGSLSQGFDQPDFLPDKFESGTMNIAGILGLKASLEYLLKQEDGVAYQHEMALYSRLAAGLRKIEEIEIVADGSTKVPVLSLNFPKHDNAAIAAQLDKDFDIMTRCGLHCAPAAHKTLGTFPQGTLRISLGQSNTIEEVDYLIASLKELLHGI